MCNPYTINGQLIAEDSNVCRKTAINYEKFANALESIESKTNIPKYEFLLGNIKTTMRDIIELNKLDTKQISRIISLAKENNISIKDAASNIKKEDRDKAIKEEQERKKREAEERKREKEGDN